MHDKVTPKFKRYQTIAAHVEASLELASIGQFNGQVDCHTSASYVEAAFRKYLESGICAHGFAGRVETIVSMAFRLHFPAKEGVCPSCNTRRMVEKAAHLSDHIFP